MKKNAGGYSCLDLKSLDRLWFNFSLCIIEWQHTMSDMWVMFSYISCKDGELEGPDHHCGREGFPSMLGATTNLLHGRLFETPILEAHYICQVFNIFFTCSYIVLPGTVLLSSFRFQWIDMTNNEVKVISFNVNGLLNPIKRKKT